MEFRKLIGFGKTSYVVSLPKKWVNKLNLKKGDIIGMEEVGKTVVLTPKVEKDQEKEEKSIEYDITGVDRTSVLHAVRSAYKLGYDEIKLNFATPLAKYFRLKKEPKVISLVHEEVNRLVGVEVVQQKENFCVIKSLSEPSTKEFDNALRKVFLILNDVTADLIEAINKKDSVLLETVEEKHDSVTKFISYCLRLINKRNQGGPKDLLLYHIISLLDKVMDIIKYSARDINKIGNKLKKDTIRILEQIGSTITGHYDLFYKFDFSKAFNLYETRDMVIREIIGLSKNHPRKELLILEKSAAILELMNDMIGSRIGMNQIQE